MTHIAMIKEALETNKSYLLTKHNMGREKRADKRLECSHMLTEAISALTALQAERKEMVEALEFYAKSSIYKPHPHGLAFDDRDRSHVAKAILLKLGQQS